MSATLLSLRSSFRLSIRDTDTTNPRISTAQVNQYANQAVRSINAKTLFYEKIDSITPNGTDYAFTLSGSGATNLAADFLAVRGFYYASGRVIAGPVDVSKIWERLASDSLVAGDPYEYALFGGQVLFDAIPASTQTIYGGYCAIPADMVADGDAPPAPLNQFDTLIVLDMKLVMADELGDVDLWNQVYPAHERRLKEFISLSESGGKHQSYSHSIPPSII
jgi:hypothetical protein